MGIGRRQFIKIMSVALAGSMIDPLRAVATFEDVYVNKKLGILFHKPQGWGFVSLKDFGKIKSEQILGNGWEEFKEEFWETFDEPICIITKYWQDDKSYKGVFSPTVTLHITPREELYDLPLETLSALSEQRVTEVLTDFHVLKKYDSETLCGCNALAYDSEYLFENVDTKRPIRVQLKVLRIEHIDFLYEFNFHQSKEKGEFASREFNAFMKSIKLL